jgi:hypothetical protein
MKWRKIPFLLFQKGSINNKLFFLLYIGITNVYNERLDIYRYNERI